MKASSSISKDTKIILSNSHNGAVTMFNIINQEFRNKADMEEKAVATLAGGVALQGHQCGLLWGAILGVGIEATKKGDDTNHSIGLAIKTAKRLSSSLMKKTDNINCKTMVSPEKIQTKGLVAFFDGISSMKCYKLADSWAPEAMQIANESLIIDKDSLPTRCRSCATRVIRELGGTEDEALMVAGFAGGLGLSGNLCGALGATIWYKALTWLREHPEKKKYPTLLAKQHLEKYLSFSGGEFLCPSLSGHRFRTIDQHCDFIAEGGCNRWINILATQ